METKRKPGRPAGIGPKLERVTITLEAADIEKAKVIGAGSISAGVRIALGKVKASPAVASAAARIPAPEPSA